MTIVMRVMVVVIQCSTPCFSQILMVVSFIAHPHRLTILHVVICVIAHPHRLTILHVVICCDMCHSTSTSINHFTRCDML